MEEIEESCSSLDQVKVIVRCRPMSMKEIKAGYKNIVFVSDKQNVIEIHDPKEETKCEIKRFTFDAVYDFASSQEQLYKESVEPIVDLVLNGFNATIFAYGQTGTGKTFTMEGKKSDRKDKGVIPRSFDQIFEYISYCKDVEHNVRCSYVEIYQEQVKDLLDKTGTRTYELRGGDSSVYINKLKSHVCKSAIEMAQAMKCGNANRKTGATNMNEHSSRSHAIFTIIIEITRTICDMKHVKVGKLNLVDLAGSERLAKSKSKGLRLKEATKINLSLSTLGSVISALSKERGSHIPYRDSKLTRFLQDSLGGNAKTLMIANIGPACYNFHESLNTLKYANRAKRIKNKPVVNEDSSKEELILKCQLEIKRLRLMVKEKHYSNFVDSRSEYLNTDESYRMTRKRKWIDVMREDILILRDLINKEEIRLYVTCEKIAVNRKLKDNKEKKLGTDVLSYTNKQKLKLQHILNKIQRIDKNNKHLKAKLKNETIKTEELYSLYMKLSYLMIENIESLYETYNKLVHIKNKTSELKHHFDIKFDKKHTNHDQLIKPYVLNQIIINNFIPRNVRQNFSFNVDKCASKANVLEWCDSKMQDEKSKISLNSCKVKSFENFIKHYSCETDSSKLNCDSKINRQQTTTTSHYRRSTVCDFKFDSVGTHIHPHSNDSMKHPMIDNSDISGNQMLVVNKELHKKSFYEMKTAYTDGMPTDDQIIEKFRVSRQLLKNL